MDRAANVRTQKLCAWSGPLLIVLFVIGFGAIARFIPPPSPLDGAEEVARWFREHTDRIRIGLFITQFAAALFVLWAAAITVQLKRIEGRFAPLAYAQLVLGGMVVLEFVFPVMVWQAAAFRPEETSAELTWRLNDLAWLPFVGIVSTAVLEAVVIGVAILTDGRERPVFPRWAGYFNLWAALLFAPGGFVMFFKSGPFAWNGLLAWWVLVVAFFAWIVTMCLLVVRNVDIVSREEQDRGQRRTEGLPG